MQGVGHIHHVHKGSFWDGTYKFFPSYGRIEDVYGIVGGAASGRRDVRDKAREAYAACVDTVLVEEPVAEQFCCHLAHTVYRLRTLDGVLWRVPFWRVGAE